MQPQLCLHPRQKARDRRPDDDVLEGRALCNEWARHQGYVDFAAAEKAGRRYGEVVAWVFARAKPRRMPLEPGEAPMSPAVKERVRRESFAEAAE